MTYAMGRELESHDMPAVRGVVRAAAREGYTLRALVQAIVASDTFQKRVKTGGAVVPTLSSPRRACWRSEAPN